MRSLLFRIINIHPKLTGFILLAMFLGGPKVSQELCQMSTELMNVKSGQDFRKWLISSHLRNVNNATINWKPISVFPEEAKRFK